jgi:hypothetical protein
MDVASLSTRPRLDDYRPKEGNAKLKMITRKKRRRIEKKQSRRRTKRVAVT